MFILKPRVNINLDLTHGGHVGHVHSCPRALHHGLGVAHQKVYQGADQGRGQAVREQQGEDEHSLGGERE